MRYSIGVAILAVMLASCPALGTNSYVLLNHENQDSYIMPSIAYDAATDQYNVTFLRATDYHDFNTFGWTADLYAGAMVSDGSGNFSLSIEECTQLNGMPVMVGTDYGENPEQTWTNPWQRMLSYTKPSRQGNLIAWSEMINPYCNEVFYHDFNTGTGILPRIDPDGNVKWYRRINPRVSGDTVSYWGLYRDIDAGATGWGMQIHSTTAGLSMVIDDCRPYDPYWKYYGHLTRSGGVYAETETTGRAIFTMPEMGIEDPMAPMAVYWSEYDLDTQTNTEPELITCDLPPHIRANNILANDKYVIWHESNCGCPPPPPGAPDEEWQMYYDSIEPEGELAAAKWNGSSYDYIGYFYAACPSSTEAALFGDYLVYTDISRSQLLMMDLRDLDEMINWPDGPPVTVLAEAASGETIDSPAVWVDENTGQYVVLYQASHSPADLMVATNIPEPISAALILIGAPLALRRRKMRAA